METNTASTFTGTASVVNVCSPVEARYLSGRATSEVIAEFFGTNAMRLSLADEKQPHLIATTWRQAVTVRQRSA